jgi:c-di-GMP-binding flagellar brake protein YcgR
LSQRFALTADHTREAIAQAAQARTIVGLTWQSREGWVMLKSRLLGVHAENELLVQFPGDDVNGTTLPEIGQDISVSFRRGSRKCVFDTPVAGYIELNENGRRIVAIRVAWPTDLHELQRRLYQRTPVPRGRIIPVDLWIKQAGGENLVPNSQRGKMLDLSAGGVSIELSRELRPRWREDEQLACRFATDSDREPVEIPARVTYYSRESDGRVRVGLQFLGLDACDRGRQTLHRIQQMTGRLRRFRRNGPG